MKKYKKYVLGGAFACFMAVALMSPIEKSEAFWSFGKAKKENNVNYTGAAVNTESKKIKPAPSITVVSPNGGEVWKIGETKTIKWKTKRILKKDKSVYVGRIALYNEHGFSIDLIPFLSKYPASGSLKWNIPQGSEVGSNFKIQVILYRDVDGGSESEVSQDFSDGFFTIAQKEKEVGITVVSPNGGEKFEQGQDVIIRWKSYGADYVNFSLIDSSGNIFNTSGTAAIKPPFVWNFPFDLNDGFYKIKIRLFKLDDREVPVLIAEDESDGFFSVFKQIGG